MSTRKEYESTSLPKDLKAELKERKGDNETYADVIRRALATEKWLMRIRRTQKQQARLQVRMAEELGIDKEQIPMEMRYLESQGDVEVSDLDGLAEALGTGMSEQSNEEITDLAEEERTKQMDTIAKAVDESGPLYGAAESEVEAARNELEEKDEPDSSEEHEDVENGGDR